MKQYNTPEQAREALVHYWQCFQATGMRRDGVPRSVEVEGDTIILKHEGHPDIRTRFPDMQDPLEKYLKGELER